MTTNLKLDADVYN